MATNSKGGKSSRSSKTDRVLGLLTDPGNSGGSDSAGNSGTGASRQTAAPKLDDKTAQTRIHDALAEELAASFPEPIGSTVILDEPEPLNIAPTEPVDAAQKPSRPPRRPAMHPAPTPPSQQQPAQAQPQQPNVQAQPAQTYTPPKPNVQAQPSQAQTAQPSVRNPEPVRRAPSVPDPVPQTVKAAETEEHFYYNIAQSIVEAKVDNFIRITETCNCERCRLDVMALALTNLPPKYVVTKNTELIPRLGMYEQKNSAEISAQILNACITVKARPHHMREE